MSIRATITISYKDETVHLYVGKDGYPNRICRIIQKIFEKNSFRQDETDMWRFGIKIFRAL